ncbi:uncharacterized protein LOC119400152 isoform X2 [Rhipicephalus sanguineus]|uniref:uncharacterized protein LOC119400152 isoform X2 n=1 Tax=Rhipicephalus sanguineus TaxID=34632 RepID=UPI00189340A8|nr:uncharacterized protein LOC119400152 isoform X2 [Rhipicephalus sanguineus]
MGRQGRPKKVRTPEERAAHREARLVAVRERQRQRRADPEYAAKERENKRRREETADHREWNAARMRALRQDPAYRNAEYERRRASTGGADARFQRRCDPLRSAGKTCACCGNSSLMQPNTTRCDSAKLADIGAAPNAQPTCINCMLRDGTLRKRSRRCYSKCIGKDDILPEHAHQSSQTEHHITLVWCPRPNISTCSAEVQVDLL